MVEHEPTRTEHAEERRRIGVHLRFADVLRHADARDRVERLIAELAVVGHADLDALGQPGVGNALARELSLRRRERDAGHAHPVLTRGVDRKAAPAAADIEHTLTRSQLELRRDQVELRALRFLERRCAARKDRAAVGHRLVEEEREKVVADVVVVADHLGVTLWRVPLPLQDQLGARAARNPARRRGNAERQQQACLVGKRNRRRHPVVDDDERGVEIVDLERALDIGASEPKRSRRAQRVGDRRRTAHVERRRAGLGGGQLAAVPELDRERPRRQNARELTAKRSADFDQGHAANPR